MTSLASVDDLQKLMRRTFAEGEELDQAEMVLSIVSAWARSASGQLWPDAPSGVPGDVSAVVLAASRRELRNPDRVITKAKGPFSVTYDKPPSGFFTDAELEILRRFRLPRRPGGLFTVSTERGDVVADVPAFLFWDGDRSDPFPAFGRGDSAYGAGWKDLDD